MQQLLWYAEQRQLVLVCASGTLLLLAPPASGGGSGGWEVVLRAKCATGNSGTGTGAATGGAASVHIAWVAQHVLASASAGDDAVRLLDLATEDNSLLQLAGVGASPWAAAPAGDGGDRAISALAGMAPRGLLAVASESGRVFTYARLGGGAGASGGGSAGKEAAPAWRPLHSFQVR